MAFDEDISKTPKVDELTTAQRDRTIERGGTTMRLAVLVLVLSACSAGRKTEIAAGDLAMVANDLSSAPDLAQAADQASAADLAMSVDMASAPPDLTVPRDYGLCGYPTRALCTSSMECACSTGTCADTNDGNMRCCQRTGQACGIAADCCKATGVSNGQCTNGACG